MTYPAGNGPYRETNMNCATCNRPMTHNHPTGVCSEHCLDVAWGIVDDGESCWMCDDAGQVCPCCKREPGYCNCEALDSVPCPNCQEN